MRITSLKYGPIPLSPIDADGISGLLLPGSKVFFCQKDFGSIMIQQINAERYSIRYSVFNFVRRMALLFEEETALLRSQLILKGKIGIKDQKTDKSHLKEGQFILLDSNDSAQTIYFENGKEYRLFDSAYSLDFL